MTVFTTLRFTPDQCKIGLEVVGLPAEHLARTHPECFNRPRSPYSPLMPRWLDQVATRTPIDPHAAVGGPVEAFDDLLDLGLYPRLQLSPPSPPSCRSTGRYRLSVLC
jgi:hypothetical protein